MTFDFNRIQKMTNHSETTPITQKDAHIALFWSIGVPLLLFGIAILFRVINLGTVPFIGDEANTIDEANALTVVHSLPFYLIFRLWSQVSTSIVWLRLLSVLLGSLAVVICWLWLNPLRGKAVGLVTA